ncbi:MAG: hypothetical protein SFW62_03860 [Alphaproteobacteria bacterium]|nr:hypothetical protein [Alphaproteobacteria bacterium]
MSSFQYFTQIVLTVPAYGRSFGEGKSFERDLTNLLEKLYKHVPPRQVAAAAVAGHAFLTLTKGMWHNKETALVLSAVMHVSPDCPAENYDKVAEAAFVLSHYINGNPVQCQLGETLLPIKIEKGHPRSVHSIAAEFRQALARTSTASIPVVHEQPTAADAKPRRLAIRLDYLRVVSQSSGSPKAG